MIFADHIRFACKACINGHKASKCRHYKKIGSEKGLVLVLNDQGVGKDQNNDEAKPFDKPQPLDNQVKIRVCKATLSESNPSCSYSKKFQIHCSPHCKNPDCDKKGIQNIFIDTKDMVLVKNKYGNDIQESNNTTADVLESYLPVSCDYLARAGVSYHNIIDPFKSSNMEILYAKDESFRRLIELHDSAPHTVASPYYSADLSKRPTNLCQQKIDLELCATIVRKTTVYQPSVEEQVHESNNKKRSLEEDNSEAFTQQPAKRQQRQLSDVDFSQEIDLEELLELCNFVEGEFDPVPAPVPGYESQFVQKDLFPAPVFVPELPFEVVQEAQGDLSDFDFGADLNFPVAHSVQFDSGFDMDFNDDLEGFDFLKYFPEPEQFTQLCQ
ncbi:hypothetical protein WICPIJ_005158 [Wickerhamomyces pijperi]|uniref:Copper-fist domain-containing protein n=1 Tax=Wickerhamomyces pijperi TaxID=599730 RepID=A0A9P8Q6I3_WICPI|nr:hypothetical protein WICPIJ_005158 [Wickerhamomyces pijperi]